MSVTIKTLKQLIMLKFKFANGINDREMAIYHNNLVWLIKSESEQKLIASSLNWDANGNWTCPDHLRASKILRMWLCDFHKPLSKEEIKEVESRLISTEDRDPGYL